MDKAIPIQAIPEPRASGPSSFYRGGIWKIALAAARTLPLPLARGAGIFACQGYRILAARRRSIVRENLRPALGGDPTAASLAANRLFSRFGAKITDLLRFEAGHDPRSRFGELSHWEHFAKAHARGAGVLMITPHLGNWEIGSTLLTSKGVKVFAVTKAEPGNDLTAMRRQARARWGIETIVVGQDTFAFVEIIRRLQEGAAVAMLIDRPAPQNAVRVELFGRPFDASLGPAELARASGCAVVGGIIVEENGKYAARFLPEFQYDRRALGSREARGRFTHQIVEAFAPSIRQYADQWYHFIPIWP